LHLAFRSRAWNVVAAAAFGLALPAAGAGPSRAVDLPSEARSEANIVNPLFSTWGPEAERVFRRENHHAKYAAEIHYDLALWFYERQDYDLSLEHYRRAAEIDPDFPEAYFGIGLLFYTLGDDDNAAKYYEQALQKNPLDPDVRNNLGLIYYRRGELDRARTEIEEALRLREDFPDALYNLGLVFYQKQQLESARTQFERALTQDPSYVRARFNLGVVYFELGELDRAAEQWRKVEESAPGTPLADQARENLATLNSSAPDQKK
jgi:type IV pilus biogenesis/stability protein PilW